ncbi:Crp/Fnr family transcriptional regulator [Dyadobacter chenwenxiniae]|uniref:Crp/Fnr family transcriptional regulator n=1 Tax=Dyadobacter chenwenxiniae TaxID=2906456 RepID=A0A9X1TG86_9BACT|nr:Crp/Fnr family transcriptional regulator [Dyadobacter chenwenxiniae]MCF0065246.1 Crp/Fnr family transcriptional regulator [Dyadobacter chenwenxiniae]UON84484.1 Crp/Fnr family transcriptional regulator [Dyadobacter chenwenxiniae]
MANEPEIYARLRAVVDKLVPLSNDEWAIFRTFFIQKEMDARTMLTRKGQIEDEIYFIHSGLMRLYYTTENDEQITAFIFSENLFASCLESFIEQIPSTQDLETLEPCSLLVLNKTGLEQLYDLVPKTSIIMRKVMEQRFISAQRLLSSYILASPQERYELFAKHYPALVQRVPQYILASFLGITPVSLSRIRKRISKS